MATIEVLVKKDGTVSIDVLGVEDGSCVDLTRALETALGTTEEVNHKPNVFHELDELQQELYET